MHSATLRLHQPYSWRRRKIRILAGKNLGAVANAANRFRSKPHFPGMIAKYIRLSCPIPVQHVLPSFLGENTCKGTFRECIENSYRNNSQPLITQPHQHDHHHVGGNFRQNDFTKNPLKNYLLLLVSEQSTTTSDHPTSS